MHRPFAIHTSLRWIACVAFLLTGFCCAEAAVEFAGAKDIDQGTLREAIGEQLQEIERRGPTAARADDAAFYLAAFYRRQGFARVKVDYDVKGATVILKITEGPKAVVRSVKFSGNLSVDSAILASFFSGVPVEKIAAAGLPFNEGEVVAGGDRVRGHYISGGWLNAAVETKANLSADGKSADIFVTVIEGARFWFGEVTIRGDAPYPREALIEGLGARPEGPFNPAVFDTMQGSLRSWLRGRGHFAAEVLAEAEQGRATGGKIPILIDVKAGPKFRVGGVTTRGLDRVKPEFIQQRFRKVTNAEYSPSAIDEKYRELVRLGLFRSIRVVPKKTGTRELTLEIEVEEAKQKEFGFEIGYGSYEGIEAVVRVGDRNFLRTGRSLMLELQTSQRGFEGELLHVDPWFLESDWTLRSKLFSKFREEDGYSRKGAGIRVEASRKLAPHWEVSAFSEFAGNNITAAGIEPSLLGPLDYTLASIGVAQKLDYRDDPLNPRRGSLFSTSVELNALDGKPAFGRVSARYSQYRSIGKSVIAAGLRFGWNIPAGEAADVPIDLRYFNGGGGTVRSFAERDLGPKDAAGNSLGGSFYSVANLEWDFPFTDTFGGAVFVDGGNLLSDATPGVGDYRMALGAGLRYQLPIGPMRLDYGYNPSPRLGEDSGALHFSFGFAF